MLYHDHNIANHPLLSFESQENIFLFCQTADRAIEVTHRSGQKPENCVTFLSPKGIEKDCFSRSIKDI